MATQTTHVNPRSVPLCVDLDSTVLRSGVLLELLFQFLRQKPKAIFQLLPFLWRGTAWLEQQLALETDFDADLLPYHEDVVEWLRAERLRGRRMILITAGDEIPARRIAAYLGLFDDVIATTSREKLLIERFQAGGYDYASARTVPSSRSVILVHTPEAVAKRARESVTVEHWFPPVESRWQDYVRMLRPHQWFKNVLLFVPLIVSHKILELDLLARCFGMFLAFSAAASGLYVWNDLLDLASDRRHPTKRRRSLAAGAVPLGHGLWIGAALLLAGGGGSALLGWVPALILAIYAATSFLYSVRFKRVLLVDVFTLAFLYMIRVVGGGAVTGILPSEWLLAFTLFWFLSLALAKRVAELHNLARNGGGAAHGRGYRVEDREQLNIFGVASGFLSSMVLAFYITTENVRILYRHPYVLWLLWPILLFWLLRIWLMVHRGDLDEDPVVFAVSDKTSYLLGALCALVMVAANSKLFSSFHAG